MALLDFVDVEPLAKAPETPEPKRRGPKPGFKRPVKPLAPIPPPLCEPLVAPYEVEDVTCDVEEEEESSLPRIVIDLMLLADLERSIMAGGGKLEDPQWLERQVDQKNFIVGMLKTPVFSSTLRMITRARRQGHQLEVISVFDHPTSVEFKLRRWINSKIPYVSLTSERNTFVREPAHLKESYRPEDRLFSPSPRLCEAFEALGGTATWMSLNEAGEAILDAFLPEASPIEEVHP